MEEDEAEEPAPKDGPEGGDETTKLSKAEVSFSADRLRVLVPFTISSKASCFIAVETAGPSESNPGTACSGTGEVCVEEPAVSDAEDGSSSSSKVDMSTSASMRPEGRFEGSISKESSIDELAGEAMTTT